MRLAGQHGIRLPPRDGSRTAGLRPGKRFLSALAVVGLAAILIAIVWSLGSERRALRALPAEQRLALLSRTVDELRQFCGEGRPAALRKHCREMASFAALFDECRGECEALVRRELAPAPPR